MSQLVPTNSIVRLLTKTKELSKEDLKKKKKTLQTHSLPHPNWQTVEIIDCDWWKKSQNLETSNTKNQG